MSPISRTYLAAGAVVLAALVLTLASPGFSPGVSGPIGADQKLASLHAQLADVQSAEAPIATPAPHFDAAVRERTAVARIATQLDAVSDATVTMAATPSPRFAALANGELMLLAQADENAPAPAVPETAEASETAPAQPEAAEQPAEKPSIQTRMQSVLTSITGAATNTALEVTEAEDAAAPAPAVVEPAVKTAAPAYAGDPMDQPVNLEFREMELTNVVALLAQKAGINVIAGTEVSGTVTASLKNIPLRKALEMVLRMNGLGFVVEEGVYRIVPYADAVAARRTTQMVHLRNAQAVSLQKTLEDVLNGAPDAELISISADGTTNVLIVSGPDPAVTELVALARSLDVEEPKLPTVTEAIKLNYAAPAEVEPLVKSMLSPEIGKVALDERSRHIIVTDVPVAVEQIKDLIRTIDAPVKQVSLETMIIDAVMSDASQTGVDWVASLVRSKNTRGETIGSLQNLDWATDLAAPTAGSALAFGVLTSEIDIRAIIAAEVQSNNAKLLANPMVTTVENKPARITIAQEIPYQELTQSTTGPPISSTEFKDVGTILEVVPRVTHDDHVIVDLQAKQSDTKGESITGIPPEDKREAETTLRVKNGQTIYIGGLRRFDDETTVRKVPVFGDVPVMNVLFRRNQVTKENTELLIFMTCHILPDDIPELTPYEQTRYDELGGIPDKPDSQRALFHDTRHPEEMRDPAWKWRRAK